MAFYESTFIARQDISAQELGKLTDNFTKIVEKNGGKVVKNENWGLRNLAYRVKKNKKGHYIMLGLDAPTDAVNELERNYKINDNVVRFLTVRVEKIGKEASPILRGDEEDS